MVGIDGKAKMSKSLGNCIFLSDPPDVVRVKVNKMYTDPTRIKATDTGHITGNVVFTYLDVFHPDKEELENLKMAYRAGKIGDARMKEILVIDLNNFLTPIRERREYYKNHPKEVKRALIEGTMRAKKIAEATMEEVRTVMEIADYEKGLS